ADWEYWGRPVPGFGDPEARVLVVGLAPAAHGGNRTGRIFTGDRSGDFLFASLHRTGFANQPTSLHRDDGLRLDAMYVAATVRCGTGPPIPPAPCAVSVLRPCPSHGAVCCEGWTSWASCCWVWSSAPSPGWSCRAVTPSGSSGRWRWASPAPSWGGGSARGWS